MTADLTLRDHARGAVREEVMRRAWTLFAEQGFEATTVDQIVAAAGMSRRTFFRYFTGKDELVLERLVESGQQIAAALGGPSGRRAGVAGVARVVRRRSCAPRSSTPTLSRPLRADARAPSRRSAPRSRSAAAAGWRSSRPLVAERLPRQRGRGPHVRAAALTGSALACLEAAQDAWAAHPGSRLGSLLDDAMAAVAPG